MSERFTHISATVPDVSREQGSGWNPGKRLVASIRDYQNAKGIPSFLMKKIAVLRWRFWSAVSGADIPINTKLGLGIILPHPTGVVIHPDAEIGVNCMIQSCVTIGVGKIPGVPRIGGHVDIGTGAKVLGGITIGDHANIGANVVVTTDVPPNARVRLPQAAVILERIHIRNV